jgi:hypothetical protein
MFNVGDIVYISEDANPTQLDHSQTLHPGDGPFTIIYYKGVADNIDYVLNVYLGEVNWWVNEGALTLEAGKKNPKSKLERKIALIYKRYEERNM